MISHDLYPARGRKLVTCNINAKSIEVLATTFTPQGDGNVIISSSSQLISLISHDLYPARGRKPLVERHLHQVVHGTISHDLYPARGRKLLWL